MRHSIPKAPQFYVTAPQECPYIHNKVERKLFTALNGPDAEILNNALSQQGFRRSQNVLYRPSCADCVACLSARIPVNAYNLSPSEKKVIRRNKHIFRTIKSPLAREEHFKLFKKYVLHRHENGGMAGMDEYEFSSMIEETAVETFLCEYAIISDGKKKILAVSLTDKIGDGLSMVYSFYDPDYKSRSLGTWMILSVIEKAREVKLPHVYLGYYVKDCRSMNYKIKFTPNQIMNEEGLWIDSDTDTISNSELASDSADLDPGSGPDLDLA